MDKKIKTKGKKRRKNVRFHLWILIALIIIVAIIIAVKNKDKKQESTGTIEKYTGKYAEVVNYVKDNYLSVGLLRRLQSGASKDNKMAYTIDVLNKEKGYNKEYSQEDVKNKYKEIFGEDLDLEEYSGMLVNGYEYQYSDKTAKFIANEDAVIKNPEDEDRTTKTIIKDCKKIEKEQDQYEVYIYVYTPKIARDFIDYASQNPYANFDMEKLNALSENSEDSIEEEEYLKNLLNENNCDKLGIKIISGKLSVKKSNNKYLILNYEGLKDINK